MISSHALAALAAIRKELERYDEILKSGDDVHTISVTVKFDRRREAGPAVVRGTDVSIERVKAGPRSMAG